jgi:hypothetical protein
MNRIFARFSLFPRELDDDEGTSGLITDYLLDYMRYREQISSDDVIPEPVAGRHVPWELITDLESLPTAR